MPLPERFRNLVECEQLPPYPAYITVRRDPNGFVAPWFAPGTLQRMAADIDALDDPYMFRLRVTADGVDVVDPNEPDHIVERIPPAEDGTFPLGHGYWPWSEYTDAVTGRALVLIHRMQEGGYTREGPDRWTVAVADHGHRCAVLGTYPTPAASDKARRQAWAALYEDALASFTVTAPDAAHAETAVRWWFAAERAHVRPDDPCQPLALPDTPLPPTTTGAHA
ncbi:MAG: hypothetical protein HOV68_05430 [Streptomycetaceae bacterium]|nr:hypothetical protein [Streptomycetaceae bacterium]